MHDVKSLLNKYYNDDNLIYDVEQVRTEAMYLEITLKMLMPSNVRSVFLVYKSKLDELKKLEDIELANFIVSELENSN